MKLTRRLKLSIILLLSVGVLLLMARHPTGQALSPHPEPNNFNQAIASQFNDNIREVAARLQDTETKLARLAQEEHTAHLQVASVPANQEGLGTLQQELITVKEELKAVKPLLDELATSHYLTTDTALAQHQIPGLEDIDALITASEASTTAKQVTSQQNDMATSLATNDRTSKQSTIPYYTLPAGADIGEATLLTALIGEVPVEGKLMQPLFPFSAIVNRDQLMAANGVALPSDIAGMKVSGYTMGVGSFLDNIRCVRAYVTSALFVFQDGHFVTVGKEESTNTTDLMNRESLGYLTTPYGNPCIQGTYYTNAPRVLTAMLAAGSTQGLTRALTERKADRIPYGLPSLAPLMAQSAASEGVVKATDWLEKRLQGSFDVVFVPASIADKTGRYQPNLVALHLTKTIELDKQLQGRKIDYGQQKLKLHDVSLH